MIRKLLPLFSALVLLACVPGCRRETPNQVITRVTNSYNPMLTEQQDDVIIRMWALPEKDTRSMFGGKGNGLVPMRKRHRRKRSNAAYYHAFVIEIENRSDTVYLVRKTGMSPYIADAKEVFDRLHGGAWDDGKAALAFIGLTGHAADPKWYKERCELKSQLKQQLLDAKVYVGPGKTEQRFLVVRDDGIGAPIHLSLIDDEEVREVNRFTLKFSEEDIVMATVAI